MLNKTLVRKIEQKQWDDLAWFRCAWIGDEMLYPKPGQFFQVVTKREDVFLPRPISVFYCDKNGIEFLVRIRGKGSAAMVDCDELFLIGPLGNWFKGPESGRKVGLLAGGAGLAPLNFLARMCLSAKREFVVVWSVRVGDQARKVVSELVDYQIEVFSEDGTFGKKGNGVDAGEYILSLGVDRLYTCAPLAMMESVYSMVKRDRVKDVQFSLEANMACGWGACKGCLTEFLGRKLYVCKDGPIVRVLGDDKVLR